MFGFDIKAVIAKEILINKTKKINDFSHFEM